MSAPILLTQAAARYGDALHIAAETTIDPETVTALDQQADKAVDGITACAAWPALRATLILNAVDGRHPLVELRTATEEHELESARDPAAVLTWRIHAPQGVGPLPWLRPIPAKLIEHPGWGPYLRARAELVQSCAATVREEAGHLGTPGWALPGQQLVPALIEDVEVWRASIGVDAADRRALGSIQLGTTALNWQRNLESKIQGRAPSRWIDTLSRIHPEIHNDPYAAVLAHRVAALHEAGVPVSKIVTALVADGPLPAEQPAAALWWRLSRYLNPAERTVTHPNASADLPHVGVVSADNPAGTNDDRPFGEAPEILADVADDRREERYLRSEAIMKRVISVKAVDGAHDQTGYPPALQQAAEEEWRDWASQAIPVLPTSKHWPAIASDLDRLNPAAVDFDRLGPRLGMFPASVVLAILKDHNDPEQADIRVGLQPYVEPSPSPPAHERHLRGGGHPRPTDGPRR